MRIEPRPRAEDPTTAFDDRTSAGVRRMPVPGLRDAAPQKETPERLAFFAGLRAQAESRVDALSSPPLRDGVVGARLDALRDAFSGPYSVDGESIDARPMFRMSVGANETSARGHAPELRGIAARAGVNVEMIRLGQGSRRDLVKTTQLLIDAGHLPPPPGDAATRIRRMQWEWGIGVDCAGYTYLAVVAASGASPKSLGLRELGMENFRGMDGKKAFTKIPPSSARAGDVMTLDPLPPETVGHNVIVRSHTTVGSRHFMEVDSSWGAGPDGADHGGFRRDTWIYDDATKLWTSFDAHVSPPVARVSVEGPAGERFHGCYRPKVGT